jgi:pimeloyl-ACP methyl ester carboxylesterase
MSTAIRQDQVKFASSLGFDVYMDLRTPPEGVLRKGIVVFCHGFGGTKYPYLMNHAASAGFIVVSIDFPGFGKTLPGSGRVLPSEQAHIVGEVGQYVEDNLMAQGRLPVMLVGATMGAAVALIAAREDRRFAALVLAHPLVVGEDRLRRQYPDEASWKKFWDRVEQADRDGEMLERGEIIYIPPNLRGHLPADTPMRFLPGYPQESVKIRCIDVLAKVIPRPVLIIHCKDDAIVPVEQAMALAASAPSDCELHLIEKGDHFILDQPNVAALTVDWLLARAN